MTVTLADHPAEHLEPAEEARRFRQLAIDLRGRGRFRSRRPRVGTVMSHRYREELRRRAAHDDAAFIEYITDLVLPDHLREMSAFANRHRKAVVLEPRGFGKTTLLCYRAARLIGLARGAIRIGILCAVDEDAENLTAAIRTDRRAPALRRGVSVGGRRGRGAALARRGLDGPRG